MYQVMDVFILPSLFEGSLVVGIEAQFAGLIYLVRILLKKLKLQTIL